MALEDEQENGGATYKPNRHRERIDEYNQGTLMGYSTFTHLRALHCHGDWDGDPLASIFSTTNKETAQCPFRS